MRIVFLSLKLAVANNRIITLQEDVERVKEESSYQQESRKVSPSIVWCLSPRRGFKPYCVIWMLLPFQAVRSDSASDGQALGETRKQLKEETLLRLVRFRPFSLLKWTFRILSLFIDVSLHVFKIPRNSLRLFLYLTAAGRGEGAGGADWDETGDGDVHEDAGEGHMWEAGRPDGAPAAAWRPSHH